MFILFRAFLYICSVTSSFCYLPLLWERAMLPAPFQLPLNPWIRDTHIVVHFQLAFLTQLLGVTISHLEKQCQYHYS